MHSAVAFGTKIAAVRTGRKLRWYADIAAAEVMQQSVIREMRLPATGADLADVQVMAVAFGTEANPVEEARFEIITLRENGQARVDDTAESGVNKSPSGVRLGIWH